MKICANILIFILSFFVVKCSKLETKKDKENYQIFDTLFLVDIVMMSVKPGIQSEGIDFGNLYYKELSSNPTQNVKVSNTGSSELVISEISMYTSSGDKEETEVFEIENPGEIRLQPGQSRELSVTFKAKEKDSYYRYVVFKNNSEYTDELGIPIRASVTGYAEAKCGEKEAAFRFRNNEDTEKTFHFFKSMPECYDNNTETVPNSVASYSIKSVPAKTTTDYQCVEIPQNGDLYRNTFISVASGKTNCYYGTSEAFYNNKDYIITKDSSISNFIKIEEETN